MSVKKQIRLSQRKSKLGDAKCLNCTILIAETIKDSKRSFKYCRYCIESGEAGKDKWRRYYQRKRGELLPKMRRKTKIWKFRKAVAQSTPKEYVLSLSSIQDISPIRKEQLQRIAHEL